MTTRTVQNLALTGLTPALAAVTASDDFLDDGQGQTFIEVANGGGGSINVTIPVKSPGPYRPGGTGPITLADIVVAVGAGARKLIGPFPVAYIDQATGKVTANFSGTSSVTFAPFKLDPRG